MSTNNDELLYDEDDSVKFIQNYLPQELKGSVMTISTIS
jgi:hypothetical protein